MSPRPAPLPPTLYREAVQRALLEDLGRAGDLTSNAVIAARARAAGVVVARAAGRIAGLDLAAAVFRMLDEAIQIELLVEDGADVGAGEHLARVRGPARAVLAAERTALNFLGHLSGIATATRDLVSRVGEHRARIVCTRKTTPGLRALEKYAVRVGGGANHRFGLDDAVLIKDNHLALAGGAEAAVRQARAAVGHLVRIEVEVESLAQLEEALAAGVDAVLLDNMTPQELAEAVRRTRGRAVTEASGGIGADSVAAVAASGVDLISVGWITHSAPSLDVALEIEQEPGAET